MNFNIELIVVLPTPSWREKMRKALLLAAAGLLLNSIPVWQALAEDAVPTAGEVFTLGDVLVTEKAGKVGQATTISTVTAEQIKQQGAKSVADVLESMPGLDIQMGSKGQASLQLRGFGQENVKVLIDGVPALEAYFGSLDLDKIPVDAIARIEVIKGASSVLYGSNTMGGVINIITKKGGKEPVTNLSTSFGANNTRNYVANHGASINNFNYWLTYSYRTSDGFELSDDFDPENSRTGVGTEFNEDGGTRNLSNYLDRTVNAKLGYEADANTQVYLSFDYHNNEKGCPTEYNRYWAFSSWEQWHLNLVGEHDISDTVTMKARLYYVDHEDLLEDVSWDSDHSTKKKWFEESTYDDYSVGGELQAYMDLGKWSQLKLGVNWLRDNHKQQDYLDNECYGVVKGWDTPGLQPEEEYEADTYSFAVENEILAVEKLSVIVGFSYDFKEPQIAYDQPVPDRMDAFNPQIGLVYDVSDTMAMHASVGKKTRFPQLIEMYSEMAGGNPDLNPQETIAYEVGLTQKVTSSMDVTLALFYNDITDRITSTTVDDDKYYQNIGESTFKGIEITGKYTAPCDATIEMNYTWLDAEDKEDSDSPTRDSEYTPKHKINLDLGYRFDFGLSTYVQASYTADQIEYDDDDNKVELDNFLLFNAKLIQELNLCPKLMTELFLEVKNLTDKDYDEGSGPMPGRSFLAGVSLTF